MLLAFLLLLSTPVDSNEIDEATVLALMNQYRAEQGLQPLRIEPRLAQAAQDRVKHMEDLGYWSHSAPDGMSPFVWLVARDYAYSSAAENLAAGFETAHVLVDSWMESPGHRRNILTPEFADVGIAIIEGSTTGPATGKSVVVLFAQPQTRVVATVRQP
jgi:uncharacterized protein YkwD